MFSDEDWKGIQKIYESVKKNDSTKVGRFGLGFKSVFHITGEFGMAVVISNVQPQKCFTNN